MIIEPAMSLAAAATSDVGLTAAILIPAIVSVIIAILSTGVTVTTLYLKSRDDMRTRQHETRLRMLDRRVDALEQAWMATFVFEREGKPSASTDDVARMSIWMSNELQSRFVRLFTTLEPTRSDFAAVRELLKKELGGLTT